MIHQVTSKCEADNYIARLNKFSRKFNQLLESLKPRVGEISRSPLPMTL